MKKIESVRNIAFLSTYPPRECGIASFTEDLITTLDYSGTFNTHVIAISNSQHCGYDNKVMAQIRQKERMDYIDMAKLLNSSSMELLVIEHEFEIYGGDQGDYILDLIHNLEIPIVTILHTVVSEPSLKQLSIINELGKLSEKIITMAQNTRTMLQSIYGVKFEKIEVIPHGVPKKEIQTSETLKKKFGFENREVISTFGLLDQEKGIENGIEAISKVISRSTRGIGDHSDLLYLIIGQTHPALNEEEGTAYRNQLEEHVNRFDISRNVKFINKYLTQDEIIEYLQVSDIYMSPYLSKDQAVSGTLAYAVGYGKAIVSTPFLYAEELLSGGNGILAEFNNSDSLAEGIKQILEDPFKKSKMERYTAKIGRTMYLDKVALRYATTFLKIITPVLNVGEV